MTNVATHAFDHSCSVKGGETHHRTGPFDQVGVVATYLSHLAGVSSPTDRIFMQHRCLGSPGERVAECTGPYSKRGVFGGES